MNTKLTITRMQQTCDKHLPPHPEIMIRTDKLNARTFLEMNYFGTGVSLGLEPAEVSWLLANLTLAQEELKKGRRR